jgi:uncharacterized Fe-S cluster protein YjdI
MAEEIIRRYTNGEITVVWRPRLCTHVGTCFRELPAVFRPAERPWVHVSAADTATIVRQVERCPSGALSHFRNAEVGTDESQGEHPVEGSRVR